MKARVILFPLLLAAPAFAAEELSREAKRAEIDRLYKEAFRDYKLSDYAQAIDLWSQILTIDPRENAAGELIDEARKRLARRDESLDREVVELIAAGSYREAGGRMTKLLADDPSNPRYKALKDRLDRLAGPVPSLPGRARAEALARRGLAAWLAPEPNLRFAGDALRYALELSPGSKPLAAALAAVEKDVPPAEPLPPGASFMRRKQEAAQALLDKGSYPPAIEACRDILALEPGNRDALKRLGQAYLALGVKDRARQAFEQALAASPNDAELLRLRASASAPR